MENHNTVFFPHNIYTIGDIVGGKLGVRKSQFRPNTRGGSSFVNEEKAVTAVR